MRSPVAEETYSEATPPEPFTVDAALVQLMRLGEVLSEAGVPAEVIVQTTRDGIARTVDRHQRSGR